MRASLVTGVYLPPDAISYSVAVKVKALAEIFGKSLEYRIFCHVSNVHDPNVRIAGSSADVALDPFFLASDLIIYEFGISYGLFDSLFLAPVPSRTLGIYHNITPERLLDSVESKKLIRHSLMQRAQLNQCAFIVCDSQYNLEDLQAAGIPVDKLDVLNLPLKPQFEQSPEDLACDGDIEILFVGRFVPSKGLIDAVQALLYAEAMGLARCRLNFVGDPTFRNSEYISEVHSLIKRSGRSNLFRFIGGVSESQLDEEYRKAHLFLMPSYHEGFCLPIIEALASGCLVVGYDAGYVPAIANGLGRIVPTGDWRALGKALYDLAGALRRLPRVLPLDLGLLAQPAYRSRCREYVSGFQYSLFRDRFREILRDHYELTTP